MTTALAVRDRRTWGRAWRLLAPLILLAASIVFVSGGAGDLRSAGGAVFVVLGCAGIAMFGAALLLGAGALLSGRPVLALDAAGVRRPARWPLPRRADRLLPWSRLAAVCLVRRAMPTRRGGVQDYLIFLADPETAELARTSAKPQLIALVLTDVPGSARLGPWRFATEPTWDVPLDDLTDRLGDRGVPVIDRRVR
jgi:hypothetical protein